MADDYEGPDPEIAAIVHRTNAECDRQTSRLKHALPAELKAVVRNHSESTSARGRALLGLLSARDPELTDLILELFDDADQGLWRMVASLRLNDPRIRAKLQQKLDDADHHNGDDNNWSQAAVMLARAGVVSLLPRFVDWLETGDEPHRNVAVECLKMLKTPAASAVLEDYWKSGKGDAEIHLVIAAALLDLGNPCGRELLESAARSGAGSVSVFAATVIYISEPGDGLRQMLHVLDNGDLDARQAMVNQIWNFAHLPHAFTADGLSEARVWVEKQLESLP